MEDKIKDFDRSIEQKMNESAVPPPFGMWNRIAAELDAAPTVAPINPAFPKSAMMGLILGAVILGSVLTASFFTREPAKPIAHSSTNTTPAIQKMQPMVAATTTTTISHNAAPVKEERVPVIVPKAATTHTIISKPVEETASVSKEESTPIVAGTNASLATANTNNQADVPSQTTVAETIGVAEEPYYFPPVDRIVPEKTNSSTDEGLSTSSSISKVSANGDEKDDDKKLAPAKEQKIHFKPHKRKKWGYGKIIRQK